MWMFLWQWSEWNKNRGGIRSHFSVTNSYSLHSRREIWNTKKKKFSDFPSAQEGTRFILMPATIKISKKYVKQLLLRYWASGSKGQWSPGARKQMGCALLSREILSCSTENPDRAQWSPGLRKWSQEPRETKVVRICKTHYQRQGAEQRGTP